MREQIKRYELNDEITIEKLKENGFKEGGIMKELISPKYHLYKKLVDDIEMLIEIDTTLSFNDLENILILDEDFCQPYEEFYNKEADDPFLNKVITKYNQTMDELVDRGLFQEKIEKKVTPIPRYPGVNYQLPFKAGTYLERVELNGKKHIDKLHSYIIDEDGANVVLELDVLSLFSCLSPKISIDRLINNWTAIEKEELKQYTKKKKTR